MTNRQLRGLALLLFTFVRQETFPAPSDSFGVVIH